MSISEKVFQGRIKLWADTLRSGRYKQARNTLKDDSGYCCLGVACEVFKEKTHYGRWKCPNSTYSDNIPIFYVGDKSDAAVLPEPVRKWFGFEDHDPIIARNTNGSFIKATIANDNKRWTFKKIADAVEKTYLKSTIQKEKTSHG